MAFVRRLHLQGLLSFPPGMEPLDLRSLNVLIGPNGSGKSNMIEALELLRSTPTDFAEAIRGGGGATEWLWKGKEPRKPAIIDVETGARAPSTDRPLRYRLEFSSLDSRVEVLDEAIEETKPIPGKPDVYFYYRLQRGRPVINVRSEDDGGAVERSLKREDLILNQSILSQRKDPDLYPEVTWIGRELGKIQVFRDWDFGRYDRLRQPQPADLPEDQLLPDNRNLALVLNHLEHSDPKNYRKFNDTMEKFFPMFDKISTRISGGTVQFYLHEKEFPSPVPSTRMSDGTIRFAALLANLLAPTPPPLICIEEPELGLHPDAVSIVGDLLVEASERTQIVVTTHSDALVSALTNQPEAVIACERPGAGTTLRRLESERLRNWLDDYALGDLWRMGELGANP